MRLVLALISIAILALGASACGSTAGHSASDGSSSAGTTDVANPTPAWLKTSTSYARVDDDKDNDVGASHDDTSNNRVLDFGHPADASDKRAIATLVKRYYATALADDAARGCSMIYSTLAEAIPEDYGEPGGPEYMLGVKTCPAAMSALFKHFHSQLEVEVPKLQITHVLIKGRKGIVVLGFGTLPEREILVDREAHVWKIAALLDSELP